VATQVVRTLPVAFEYASVKCSPTSDMLALTNETLNKALFLLDPRGASPPRRIVSGLGQDGSFGWSSDGRHIFVSRSDQIWTVNPNGTGLRKISRCAHAGGACTGPLSLPLTPSGFRRVRWRDVN
jgi:hypothetical protein